MASNQQLCIPEIIAKKRDRHALSKEEIKRFVTGVKDKSVGPEQLGK